MAKGKKKKEEKTYNRVDKIHISKKNGDKYFKKITEEANNIYNFVNFYIRQNFFFTKGQDHELVIKAVETINNEIEQYNLGKDEKEQLELVKKGGSLNLSTKFSTIYYNILKNKPLEEFPDQKNPYQEIPAAFVQSMIKDVVMHDWKSYFAGLEEYRKDKSKFKACPKPPGFKRKNGVTTMVIMANGFNNKGDYVKLSEKKDKTISGVFKKSRSDDKLTQIRLIPKRLEYIMEMVYQYPIDTSIKEKLKSDINRCISIDLGINDLCTVTNNFGNESFIINGKVIKSINQHWNKERAKALSYIGGKGYSNRTELLDRKRNNKIDTLIHKVSRYLVNYCMDNKVDTIIIGYNKGWKQNSNMSKKTNQHFIGVPFKKLIDKITYKANDVGIKVKLTQESYTSKCDALTLENIGHHDEYLGKRKQRGQFQSAMKTLVNADVNGSLNIMRKVIGDGFIQDYLEHMELLTPKIINIV